jgi:drug/metabolite transporter (DMT)-like permease
MTNPIPQAHARAEHIKGMLILIASTQLFGVMDGVGKILTVDCSFVQIVWARFFFAVPVVLLATAPAQWKNLFRSERPSLQAARGMLPVFINCAVIIGVSRMPLADATAIGFMSPLLVVAFSAFLLSERASAASWTGVVSGFVGVLLVARPGTGIIGQAALFPLAGAVAFAIFQILTRMVGQRDAPRVTWAWTVATGALIMTPAAAYSWHPVGAGTWLLLIGSGIVFGFSQMLFIQAYRYATATALAPLTYAQIIAAVLFGLFVFGDIPDLWTLAGTALIILSGLYVLRQQSGR